MLLVGLLLIGSPLSAQNSPPPEFERLLDELFNDELERFDDELVPRELLEELFRDSAAATREGGGVRSLERDREPGRFERNHPTQLEQFKPLLSDSRGWVASLLDGSEQVAMATVIDADGLLVTKASEIESAEELTCKLTNGRQYNAQVVDVNEAHDLALIRIDAGDLEAVEWSTVPPRTGNLVVTGDAGGDVISWGVVSVAARALMNSNQAVLGVVPQPALEGIIVQQVQPTSPADDAGIEVGDVILSIGGTAITSVNHLANTIRLHEPGDTIEVQIRRGDETSSITAVLAGRNVSGRFSQNMRLMNRFGSEPSRRNSDFPNVVQHDTPLWPEQCGGPLIGLDGKALGINIARGGRVASYAIPADSLEPILDRWISQYDR